MHCHTGLRESCDDQSGAMCHSRPEAKPEATVLHFWILKVYGLNWKPESAVLFVDQVDKDPPSNIHTGPGQSRGSTLSASPSVFGIRVEVALVASTKSDHRKGKLHRCGKRVRTNHK